MPKPRIGVNHKRRKSNATTVKGAIKRANKGRARAVPKVKIAKMKTPKVMTWSTYDAIARAALARDNSPESIALREVAERKKQARKIAQAPASSATAQQPSAVQTSTGEALLDDYRIDPARVRRYFDKRGINGAINEYVMKLVQEHGEEVEVESKPFGKRKDEPRDPSTPPKMIKKRVLRGEHEVRQRACANARVRVSPYATTYLRTFCEEIACDLTHLAIHGMIAKHDCIMKEEHIFHNDCEFLNFAHFRELFINLPTFVNARKKWLKYNTACYVQSIIEPLLTDFAKIRDKDVMDRVKRNRAELEKFIAEERARVMGTLDQVVDDETKRDTQASASAAASSTGSTSAQEHAAASATVPSTTVPKTKQSKDDGEKDKKDDLRFAPYVRRVIHTIIGTKPEFARNKPRVSLGLVQFINETIFDFVNCVSARAIVYIDSVESHTVSDGVVQEVILSMVSNPEAMQERTISAFETETRIVRAKETEKGKAPEKIEQTRVIARVRRPTFIQFIRENYPVVVHTPRKPKEDHEDEEQVVPDEGEVEVEGEEPATHA